MVRVRFAPSPTGIPHIGNTRTALFNFLFAKANKGEFILRIEDTDQKRIIKGAEEAILEILNWLSIKYNGEVLHQSERLEIYKKYADELLDKKLAYKNEGAVWVKIPQDKTFSWTDLVGNKKISFNPKSQEDFVILKSDGFPTYHLANVVDDHLMGITHVIRGEEWISSTPKHIHLYESFGWKMPEFAHLPVILGPDKSKLSKRHGAKSALDYRKDGFLKEALLNYIALLGWNPGGDKEVMNIDEMIKLFKIEDINSANPIFDSTKLEWLNGVWIRTIAGQDLKNRLIEFYKDEEEIVEILKSSRSDKMINAASSRMKTLKEFKILINTNPTRKKTEEEQQQAIKLSDFLKSELGEGNWEDEKFLAALKNFSSAENIPFKKIYFLLTQKNTGIGLLELNQIFGKDFFVKNLNS